VSFWDIEEFMGAIGRVRRSRRFVVAVALTVVVGTLSLVSSPVSADPAASDPGQASILCRSGSYVDGLTGPADGTTPPAHGYIKAYIPHGSTAHFIASGTTTTSYYFAGQWGAQYSLYLTGSAGGQNLFSKSGRAADDYPESGPVIKPFSTDLGTWLNNGDSDTTVTLDLSATRGIYGGGISWNVQVVLDQDSGGSSAGVCPAASEFYGPNAAYGQQCPHCAGDTQFSVSTFTGNEHYVLPGFSLKTFGPGIGFQLAYDSLAAAADGSVGHGWNDSFEMSLHSGTGGSEEVTQETGATVGFASPDSGATWAAPARFNATLVKNSDGSWTFTRAHRQIFTFDSSGRLTKIADRNGYQTSLTYGTDGLSTVVDTAGHQVNVAWASGRISTLTDVSDAANPRTIGFAYDASGNLTSYTDVGGGVWTLGYDASHRLVSVRSPRYVNGTAARQFHYDAQGRVDWEQDPLDQRTTLKYDTPAAGATEIDDPSGKARVDYYDSLGRRIKVTTGYGTPLATSTSYTYNSAGMITDRKDGNGHDWLTTFGDSANPYSPTRTTDPLGRVRNMMYNASGDLTQLTDANGVVTTYTYDANGNPKTTTVGSGSNTPAVVTYNYGDIGHPGQLTSVVDPRNKTWSYGHDAQGDLTSMTDPLGRITKWTYNPQGWPLTKIAPAGNVSGANPADFTTTYSYNGYGRRLQVTDPLGHHTTTSYDADGNIATITDGAGDVTTKTWNAGEQLASVTRGSGTASARTLGYSYDPDGNVATYGYSPGTTYTLSWNSLGLLAAKTDPVGHQTTYGYDANGNLTTTTAGAGTSVARTTAFAYDADNNRTSRTLGSGSSAASTTQAGYNIAAGTSPCTGVTNAVYCTTWTDGAGHVTTSFYDALGVVIQKNRPGGKTYSYTHDASGRQTGMTDPGGTTTTYTYDDAGEIAIKSNGQNTTYDYTQDGLLSTVHRDGALLTSYSYDRSDQVTSISGVGYGRDSAGRVNAITYPDSRHVGYSYDAAGDVTSLSDGAGNTIGFGYSPDGSLTSKSFPGGNTIATTLNGDDLPTSIGLTNGNGDQLTSMSYTYDATNAVTGEVDTTGGTTSASAYTYDGQGRLATSTTGPSGASNPTVNYGYDAAGNMTTYGGATQTFDAAGELTGASNGGLTTTYDYNARGDRTKAIPSNGLGSTYSYDANNRMVSATTAPPPSFSESDYHPLPGNRILDTRASTRTGTCVGTCATLTAGGTLTFQVTGNGGVPSNASSVVLDVTTLNATTGGAVVLYPTGSSSTGRDITTSTGNVQTQAVITGVSASGQVTVKSSVAVDVVVDVQGYYATTTNQSGALFDSINSTRIVDTRSGQGVCTPSPCARIAAAGTTTVQITGQAGIPTTGVVGVAYTLTAISPGAAGYAIDYQADQARPATVNLAYSSGVTSSALAVTPLSSSGQIKIYSTAAADYTVDVVGYYTQAVDGDSSMYVPFNSAIGNSPRVLDTAGGTGTCQPSPCAKLVSGTPMGINLGWNNVVPSNATSAVLSVTLTTPTANGYLSLAPGTAAPPALNNVFNYSSGITKTATTIVGVQNDWITAQTHSGNADMILDVQGYFVAPTWTTTYTYDDDGLLASSAVLHVAGTRTYTYDHLGTNGTPQLLNDSGWDYIYAPDGSLLETTSDPLQEEPSTYFDVQDSLNSSRLQFQSSGAVMNPITYTPYGVPNRVPAGAGGFAGGVSDRAAPTGFTYLLNRYYDAATGSFTTPDPLVDLTGQPYGYADDNPTNETDPTGADPAIGGAIGGLVGAGGNLLFQISNNLAHGCGAFSNISWGEVAEWGLQGALIGSGLGGIADALDSLTETAALFDFADVGEDSVQVFRNVDLTEFESIANTGKFTTGDGMMEGKWFATSGEHAEQWGTKLNGGQGLTVETRIPQSVADQLHYEGGKLDGIGPGWYADHGALDLVNRFMDGIRLWR
jgi:RHS repeat-associated protein